MNELEIQVEDLRQQLMNKFYAKVQEARINEAKGYPAGLEGLYLTKGEAYWYYDVDRDGNRGVIASKAYNGKTVHRKGEAGHWMFLAYTYNGTVIEDDSREVAEMYLGYRIFGRGKVND